MINEAKEPPERRWATASAETAQESAVR